jgi:short-subunit dehydrogenase
MKKIIIIGATSAIAEQTAREFAKKGYNLYLIARNIDQLDIIQRDLKIRGAHQVYTAPLDINDIEAHLLVLNKAFKKLGHVDIVLVAHGTLPNQNECQRDINTLRQELNTNALSTVLLLTDLANRLELQKSGTIAVITSVAGMRGKQSNYVYTAAKSMVSTFLQGLRNRLYSRNIHVLDIKPGFITTPMTGHFNKGLLWVKPERIAKNISDAVESKKDVLYAPFYWRYIMMVICSIPEKLFKRLKL